MPLLAGVMLLALSAPARAASYDGLAPNLTVEAKTDAERRSLDDIFKAGLRSVAFWRAAHALGEAPVKVVVAFGDTGARLTEDAPAGPEDDHIPVSGAWGRTEFSTGTARVTLSSTLVGRDPGRVAAALAHELLGHAAPGLEARAAGMESYNGLDTDELYARLLEAAVEAELGGDKEPWQDCREGGPLERRRAELPFEDASYAGLVSPADAEDPLRVWKERLPQAEKRLEAAKAAAKDARLLLRRAEDVERSEPSPDIEDRAALTLLRFYAEERYPTQVRRLKGVIAELKDRLRSPKRPGWKERRDGLRQAASSPLVAAQERKLAELADRCAALQPGDPPDRLAAAERRLRRRVKTDELPDQ